MNSQDTRGNNTSGEIVNYGGGSITSLSTTGTSAIIRRRVTSEGIEEIIVTRKKRPRYSRKLLRPEDNEKAIAIINKNAQNNPGQALLESDLHINEELAEMLENDIPRAAGYQGKNPNVYTMLVYYTNDEGDVVLGKVDRHFSLITKSIYAIGSEIGYIGSSKKEKCHYDVVMQRFLNSDTNYKLHGMLSPQLIQLIKDGHGVELNQWHHKWQKQIENATYTLRSKCNVHDGVR